MLASAVRRGLRTPLLVGDLPFGSYEASDEQAIATAQRFIKEAGCDAVKLERGGTSVAARPRDRRRRHPGDGPRRADAADRHRARRLPGPGPDGRGGARRRARRAGAPGGRLLLDRVRGDPGRGRRRVMERLEIPVIGIGAGPATDGQVLVFHDLLGIYDGHAPRFVKRYADLAGGDGRRASPQYAAEVRAGAFPGPEHSYSIDERGARALPGRALTTAQSAGRPDAVANLKTTAAPARVNRTRRPSPNAYSRPRPRGADTVIVSTPPATGVT